MWKGIFQIVFSIFGVVCCFFVILSISFISENIGANPLQEPNKLKHDSNNDGIVDIKDFYSFANEYQGGRIPVISHIKLEAERKETADFKRALLEVIIDLDNFLRACRYEWVIHNQEPIWLPPFIEEHFGVNLFDPNDGIILAYNPPKTVQDRLYCKNF